MTGAAQEGGLRSSNPLRQQEVALSRKPIVLFLVALLLLAACGGRQEVYEVAPDGAAAASAAELELPDPIPAVPAYLVSSKKALSARRVDALARTPGAAVVVPVSLARTKVKGPKGTKSLRVAALDPVDFRAVAPAPTRDADFVWVALVGGEAVVTHQAADRLGFQDAGQLDLGGERVRVGAFADNGTPNFADVVVDSQSLDLGGRPRAVVVGAKSGITLETLAKDLRRKVPGARLVRLVPSGSVIQPRAQIGPPATPGAVASGLHPTLAAAVERLLQGAGGRVWVVSGFRTYAHQYTLYVSALRRYGDPEIADNWVAPPGRSMHEHGLAVDLGGDLALAVRIIDELGLPLWRPMSWEPWHFELVGSRG
ncbi:MAG: D-alanyl-D-alanine carboxypeptidase family protein [Actinomycetota bacterium]